MGARLADALNDGDLDAQLARAGIETRPATREDVGFAFETLRESMHDSVAAAFGGWDDAQQYALFAPSFDLRTHRVLRLDGADAGILAVEAHVDRIHLARIFLRREARRRGLGGRTVRVLLAWAHARDLPLVLTVLRTNPAAQRFYARLGFEVIGETSTHVHLEAEPAGPIGRIA